ncbi:hypothetical protein Tco_1541666 [Tanacetum coccineum]
MEVDLEARLMGETLVINKSLDPLNGDYIELNNLNEPFELRKNQGNDLMPTIEEGEKLEVKQDGLKDDYTFTMVSEEDEMNGISYASKLEGVLQWCFVNLGPDFTHRDGELTGISKRTPYTAYNNPQGIIYVDKFKRNRLMRSDELYKFSDGTLTSLRSILHDIASNLRMNYLAKEFKS